LFILVRFVNFNRFTLHRTQITFFNQFYYFLHFSPNIFKNCNSVQILHFIAEVSNSNFQNSPVLVFIIFKTVQMFNCISVLKFLKLHFSPFFQFSSQVPRKRSIPRVTRPLGQIHTWQAINSTQCHNHIQAPSHKQSQIFLSHVS